MSTPECSLLAGEKERTYLGVPAGRGCTSCSGSGTGWRTAPPGSISSSRGTILAVRTELS